MDAIDSASAVKIVLIFVTKSPPKASDFDASKRTTATNSLSVRARRARIAAATIARLFFASSRSFAVLAASYPHLSPWFLPSFVTSKIISLNISYSPYSSYASIIIFYRDINYMRNAHFHFISPHKRAHARWGDIKWNDWRRMAYI